MAKPAASPKKKKTAVVVVHGMGEQRPMDTLWGLVTALWKRDPEVSDPDPNRVFTYSKPDDVTGSFELRRITTGLGVIGRRFDFFECYWAHLMSGNTVDAVVSAVTTLLLRKRSTVPPRLVAVWIFGCVAMLLLSLLVIGITLSGLPTQLREQVFAPFDWHDLGWLALLPILAFGLRWLGKVWIGPVAGDAARYLSATPPNVGVRQTIREAAVDLLEKLHARGDYDRIVVIGHSLGTAVAYDALTFAWSRIDGVALAAAHRADRAATWALGRLERAAAALIAAKPADIGARRIEYRQAQRAYFAELSRLTHDPGDGKGPRPFWLVSDFVSTAAPLSKADVLMAHDPDDFKARKKRRELPACPPWLESMSPPRFSYYPKTGGGRAPHHAAVFGPTVWTNIYFETEAIVLGDVIGGRVANLFGRGALDVRLKRGDSLFRHLDYWKDPEHADMASGKPHPWITALRKAANLNGVSDAQLWGVLADVDEVAADHL